MEIRFICIESKRRSRYGGQSLVVDDEGVKGLKLVLYVIAL